MLALGCFRPIIVLTTSAAEGRVRCCSLSVSFSLIQFKDLCVANSCISREEHEAARKSVEAV